ICSETSLFAIGLIGNLILILTQIIFILSICLFLIFYNIYSLYVILFLLFVCGIIIKITNAKFKKWGEVRQETSALVLKRINEIVGSIKEVILYNKRNFFAKEFYSHSSKLANANIYRDTTLSYTAPIIEFMGVVVFFSFFLFLVVYSSHGLGEITVLFGVFAFASIKLLPASIALARSLQGIKFNMPACDVVYEILLNSRATKKFNEEEKSKKIPLNSIKFDNVNFTYKNQKNPTLNQVNFEINKGDKIAIIGETGSGKTTLLNIIATLVTPSNGKIKINGSDQLDGLKEIRDNIGYVSQSVYLFDNSIISNISLSSEFSIEDEEKILKILKSVNLSKINNKPIDVYDTIGERGSKLSGGQIQRIGIARALYRDPNILILDEATNALDEITEKQILDFLFKKFEDKFVILCTHKKELLKYCNKILEIKNNTVILKKT
ncbi:ABC transporter ATP-binding protein, partial [Candidatus Pelagibacter sp.]|nr:ABC transporter ATP-binding protein [Candidatus Pelagibacter sp.]